MVPSRCRVDACPDEPWIIDSESGSSMQNASPHPFYEKFRVKVRDALVTTTTRVPAVSIFRASKVYPEGGKDRPSLEGPRALHDVSLTIHQGEFVAITGPSGSGKSTLMNIIGCLDEPSEGEVRILGVAVHSLDDAGLTKLRAKNIGFVFQSFNLIPRLTVLQNVALPMALLGRLDRAERDDKARRHLAELGLGGKEQKFPSMLSGGEQQRVAIARALANDPSIILADEPTGNLDSNSGRRVLHILETLNSQKGVTVVIVTHDESIASAANVVVRMRDGAVETIVLKDELSAPPREAERLEVLGSIRA
jgi:putative ABC transport system ATP-binding protein